MSRVDVIIPCYRYAHLLRQCVRSVLDQRGVQLRVLIIDDCSPDDAEAIGRTLAAEDSRIEFRRHDTNQRHIATFNEGLAWATGDYCMILSADDLLAPGALRRAAEAMDKHRDVTFVYGRTIPFRDTAELPSVIGDDDSLTLRIMAGAQFLRDACATGDNVVLTPSVIVRTSVQHEIGGYRPELTHSGDFEMWMRLAACGSVGCVDETQAYYRKHGENMSATYSLLRDIEQRDLAFSAVFQRMGARIAHAESLRQSARRALSTTAFWEGCHAFDRGDHDSCQQFHELAARIDPSIRKSPSWKRFKLKRLAGRSTWLALRPLVRRMKTATTAETPST